MFKNKDLCYWHSGHGPVFIEHGPVSDKNLQVSSQTAELGDGHGGVSAEHVPVWTVC